MYNEATRCYHVVAESQSADNTVNRTIPKHWPSIETTRINVTCLLVYGAYTEMSRNVTTQILCVLIDEGRLSRPMICLRCKWPISECSLPQ